MSLSGGIFSHLPQNPCNLRLSHINRRKVNGSHGNNFKVIFFHSLALLKILRSEGLKDFAQNHAAWWYQSQATSQNSSFPPRAHGLCHLFLCVRSPGYSLKANVAKKRAQIQALTKHKTSICALTSQVILDKIPHFFAFCFLTWKIERNNCPTTSGYS